MVEEYLRFQGIPVVGAENGLQGLTALRENAVVVLSALSDCGRHAEALGAVDVIPKPIDFDRMLAVVRRYYEA
jgi:DNA-binding response OmpR family regulator